jgi:hypothetical protein
LNGRLQLNDVDGLAVQGAGPSGTTPATGATVPITGGGSRMMFLPGYAAFRAGSVDDDRWDPAYVGISSTAFGGNTTASGLTSFAAGNWTTASGDTSTALGIYTVASGNYSTSAGIGAHASSYGETALGIYPTFADGSADTFIQNQRLFVIGNGQSSGSRHNALVIWKNGGTEFSAEVRAPAFTTVSDRNLKTDFTAIDTAEILARVAALPLSTWRFKDDDDAATHLGPMAQDFAAAFHLGDTDTGIATVDADGVALAAIQELKKQLDAKDARIRELEARLAAIEARLR